MFRRNQWVWRGFCIPCGLLGIGIFIRAIILGGGFIYLGIACLLIGLIVASLVTRKW